MTGGGKRGRGYCFGLCHCSLCPPHLLSDLKAHNTRLLYIPARRTRATPASMSFFFPTISVNIHHHECDPRTISEITSVHARHRQRPCHTHPHPSSASLSSHKKPSCGQKRITQRSPAPSVLKTRDPPLRHALHRAPPRITLAACSVAARCHFPSKTTATRMGLSFVRSTLR